MAYDEEYYNGTDDNYLRYIDLITFFFKSSLI